MLFFNASCINRSKFEIVLFDNEFLSTPNINEIKNYNKNQL